VSELFGGHISVRTLSNWRWSGKGPRFTRVGGRILYPAADVMAWAARRTVTSTSEYRRDDG
jgi:hypothetical protein